MSSLRLRQGFLAALLILTTACVARNYQRPIAGFRTASAQVIAAAKDYYELANKIERDHLIDDLAATGDTLDPKELAAVSERFPAEDIAVRLDSLGVLSDYGSLLLQLATNDAPQDVATQVGALTNSVGSLSNRLTKLCTNCSAANTQFKSSFGAVTSILKPLLSLIVAGKIEKGLDTSIRNAEKPVSDLIALLREDLSNLFERRRQALSLALSDATRAYNTEAKLGAAANRDRLLGLAQKVKLAADRVAKVPNSSPDAALAAMDRAHRSLVAFSNKKKSPQSLAELADSIQAFAIVAQQAGQGIRTLMQ